MVYLIYICGVDGVEFLYVVVYKHQGVVNGLTVDHGGVAQYGDLRLGTILVAQADGVADDLSKVGVAGGLAVAGKGQHVGQLAIGYHLFQFDFEFGSHFFSSRQGQGGTVVFVETTFAIDAVEGTDLAVGRQQVDA